MFSYDNLSEQNIITISGQSESNLSEMRLLQTFTLHHKISISFRMKMLNDTSKINSTLSMHLYSVHRIEFGLF